MSIVPLRSALETALDGMSPALSTAWENVKFEPVNGTPYQMVHVLYATPDNPTIGGSNGTVLTRYKGFMQVTLMYPLLDGAAAIEARAELIKATFTRGSSFTNSGQVVVVNGTPEVTSGIRDNDRWRIAVKIPFYSNVYT
jgi:hypothetical protein